jgi:hypothetical protein
MGEVIITREYLLIISQCPRDNARKDFVTELIATMKRPNLVVRGRGEKETCMLRCFLKGILQSLTWLLFLQE